VASLGGNAYSGLVSFGSKVAFHVGGIAEISVSEKFAIQPELLYSLQGTKWDFGIAGDDLSLHYINLPVLGKYYILEGLSAEVGAVAGYLLSASTDNEAFKSFDVAFAIGASYKLNDNIFFSLRYNKGIMNINNDSDLIGSNQNNVLQISAGYTF